MWPEPITKTDENTPSMNQYENAKEPSAEVSAANGEPPAASSSSGSKTVFTDGVFDMLHANHVSFLQEAKSYGDKLVVGVVSDAQARTFKRCPVIPEAERLQVVAALACVDEAFIITAPLVASTMERVIAEYGVDKVVYSGDSTPEFYVPAENAGMMHRPAYRAGVNSTKIIARVIALHNGEET